MRVARAIVKGFANIGFRLLYRVDIKGLENIPKESPAILCSNHIHALDSVLYVSRIKRMVFAMGKEELFNTKFKNWFMYSMGVFPVKRDSVASEEAINTAVERLNDKDLLMIFPEGTRNGLEKGVKPKRGVALIALKAKVPILPMAMEGSFKPFTKIKIRIGEAIDFKEYYPSEGEKINPRNLITITNDIMNKVVELRDGE